MLVLISGEFVSGLLPPDKFSQTKWHTNKITDQSLISHVYHMSHSIILHQTTFDFNGSW